MPHPPPPAPSPPPPPPPPRPPAQQPQLASPTLLRRIRTQDPRSYHPESLSTTCSPDPDDRPTPPPPPRSGQPILDPVDFVPDSPFPSSTPASSRRTYVDAVRGNHVASTGSPRQYQPRQPALLRGATSVHLAELTTISGRGRPRSCLQSRPGVIALIRRVNQAKENGYIPVRERYWWRKERSSQQPAPRRPDKHSRRANNPNPAPASSTLAAFKRRTEGRCFKCLASTHWASSCRDPVRVRCFACLRSGHKAAWCNRKHSGRQQPPNPSRQSHPPRQRPRQQSHHQRHTPARHDHPTDTRRWPTPPPR